MSLTYEHVLSSQASCGYGNIVFEIVNKVNVNAKSGWTNAFAFSVHKQP
jgi:hypothetical protein